MPKRVMRKSEKIRFNRWDVQTSDMKGCVVYVFRKLRDYSYDVFAEDIAFLILPLCCGKHLSICLTSKKFVAVWRGTLIESKGIGVFFSGTSRPKMNGIRFFADEICRGRVFAVHFRWSGGLLSRRRRLHACVVFEATWVIYRHTSQHNFAHCW